MIRRRPDGTLPCRASADPIQVAVDRARPTSSARPRQIADALAATIAAAPEQWYSFKPMWPADRRAEPARARARGRGRGWRAASDDAEAPAAARAEPARCRAAPREPRRSGAARGSRRGALVGAASWLACRLPEGRCSRSPDLVGELWYRLAPDARGPGAAQPPARRRATSPTHGLGDAADPRRRDRSAARSSGWSGRAFRHDARYYLEVARTPALDATDLDRRLIVETPGVVRRRVRAPAAADLRRPALRADRAAGAVSPPPRRAGRHRADGDDRRPGAPGAGSSGRGRARAPASSACARRAASSWPRCGGASRSGSSAIATSPAAASRSSSSARRRRCRSGRRSSRSRPARPTSSRPRSGAGARGRYSGGVEPVHDRRRTARAASGSRVLEAEARAFERTIVDAPRSSGGRCSSRSGRICDAAARPIEPAGSGAAAMTDRLGRADLHIHTLASDGTSGIVEILDHVERDTELDVIAITDHERIDAACRPGRWRATRPAVRGHRRRGGHDARRPPARRCSSTSRSGRCARCASTIAADPRAGRPGDPGPSARALSAVRPAARAPAPARPSRSALPSRRDRGVQPDDARARWARARARRSSPRTGWRRSAAATPTRPSASARAGPRFPGSTAGRPARGDRRRARPRSTAASTPTGSRSRDVRAAARARTAATSATRSRGKLRRDGTGRDLGYPGGRRRPAASIRAGAERAGDEDRPRHAVHLPAARRRQRARPATSTRTSGCAATTSASSAAPTARSAPREGDIIRLGYGF